jgi:nucleoside 2-deoxyribosyltransferase
MQIKSVNTNNKEILGGKQIMAESKNLQVNNSLNELAATIAEAQKLIAEGHNYNSPELYDAAVHILNQADIFVGQLDEFDDNMDPETTNIPELDYLFEDNPVTDYVDARINFAMGDDSEENLERMKNAADKISESYDEDEECVCSADEHCEDCPLELVSLHSYVTALDEDISQEVNAVLDMIEDHLQDAESFDKEDTDLIRFYLRHLPSSSFNDIEELSDRAVQLAFKTRMMNLGKL